MLFGTLSVQSTFAKSSIATSGKLGTNLKWAYKDGTLAIKGTGKMDYIGYVQDFPWYPLKDSIQKVVVKAGVTSITCNAFYQYKNLKSFSIPETLEEIEPDALEGTAWYNAQPNGPVYFAHILYGYKGTMPEQYKLKVKNGTTAITRLSFQSCENLVRVSIPDSVTYIGDSAFCICHSLASVRMSKNLTYAGNGIFEDSIWIGKQPNGLLYLGHVAQYYIGTIPNNTTLKLKKGTTGISAGAFVLQPGLTGIRIPETVTRIGAGAFDGTSLKKIYIPKSVTDIEYHMIESLKLRSITVDPENPVYTSDKNGCLFNKRMTILYQYPAANKSETYQVPSTVKIIAGFAFAKCNILKKITLPAKVRTIQDSAFLFCKNLKKIVIKNPKCNIFDDDYTINYTATIYGYAGSTAQAYAEKYNRTFVAIR